MWLIHLFPKFELLLNLDQVLTFKILIELDSNLCFNFFFKSSKAPHPTGTWSCLITRPRSLGSCAWLCLCQFRTSSRCCHWREGPVCALPLPCPSPWPRAGRTPESQLPCLRKDRDPKGPQTSMMPTLCNSVFLSLLGQSHPGLTAEMGKLKLKCGWHGASVAPRKDHCLHCQHSCLLAVNTLASSVAFLCLSYSDVKEHQRQYLGTGIVKIHCDAMINTPEPDTPKLSRNKYLICLPMYLSLYTHTYLYLLPFIEYELLRSIYHS